MFLKDIIGSVCADDIHVFYRSADLFELKNVTNITLHLLSMWIFSNGLAVDWNKTEAVHQCWFLCC